MPYFGHVTKLGTENIIGAGEVAAMLNQSIRTVHRKAKSGGIPAKKLGGSTKAYIFKRSDIEALLTSQSSSSGTDIPTGTRPEEGRFTPAGDAA